MKKHIGIIVGHTSDKKGAVSYSGVSEYDYNIEVAKQVTNIINSQTNHEASWHTRNKGYKPISDFYRENNVFLSIELHFNSYNKQAYGMEMLVLEGNSFDLADNIISKLARYYNIKERANGGVKDLSRTQRGAWCLSSVDHAKHKMLIEPCFANFKTKDSEKFFEPGCRQRYAVQLAEAIITACNLGFDSNPNQDIINMLHKCIKMLEG